MLRLTANLWTNEEEKSAQCNCQQQVNHGDGTGPAANDFLHPRNRGNHKLSEEESEEKLQPLADEVYELFERVAKAAFRLSGGRGRFPEIPRTAAEQLSFLVTAAFNLDNTLKYQML